MHNEKLNVQVKIFVSRTKVIRTGFKPVFLCAKNTFIEKRQKRKIKIITLNGVYKWFKQQYKI